MQKRFYMTKEPDKKKIYLPSLWSFNSHGDVQSERKEMRIKTRKKENIKVCKCYC